MTRIIKNNNKNGFTLVEVIISVAVLCLVCGIMLRLFVSADELRENNLDIEKAQVFVLNEMEKLKSVINQFLAEVCSKNNLTFETGWFDYFPASVNDPFCNELILKAAKNNNFEVKEKPLPYKFGEDFGWFSKNYKSAMFGLGSAEDCPALHNPDYDFPEAIIPTGMVMFSSIIEQILGKKNIN